MRDAGVDAVPHGFRFSFRSWAAEVAKARHEVAEAALAHKIRDKTEAAYLRAAYLDERRELMVAWAAFVIKQAWYACSAPASNVASTTRSLPS